MKMTINIEMNATLQWRARQTSPKHFMAECEALDLALESESLDELNSLIPESLNLLFTDLLNDGELDAFLRAKGWKMTAPPHRANREVEFRVPFELIVANAERARDRAAVNH